MQELVWYAYYLNTFVHGYGFLQIVANVDFHIAYGRQGYKRGYNMKNMKW